MVTLQDEINKRRSKTLHLLNTAQVVYETGAVADIETFRQEALRPDGTMEVSPGALANRQIEFRTRDDLATAHFQLLQEAKNAIDVKGPNAIEMGDGAAGAIPPSGRAILASQQGGMIQVGDLFDNLRHLDRRVFRAVWARVRQFWTAEKWVRVTDDERNVRWLGLNLDPYAMAQLRMRAQEFPQEAQASLAGVVGPLAELDCDIIIDEAPDSLTPQIEQFQSLVELKKYDAAGEIPFRAIVRAMPNLKDKQMFLKDMEAQATAAGAGFARDATGPGTARAATARRAGRSRRDGEQGSVELRKGAGHRARPRNAGDVIAFCGRSRCASSAQATDGMRLRRQCREGVRVG